jgi:serine/threonine-protein kinase
VAAAVRAEARARLATLSGRLQEQAARAARVPELRQALESNVDRPTFQDLFETEEWWAPQRAPGLAAALLVEGELRANGRTTPAAFWSSPLVAQARDRAVTGTVVGDGQVYLAAATPAGPAVLILGRHLGREELRSLAAPPLSAAALVEHKHVVATSSGEGVLAARLPALVEHEPATQELPGGGVVTTLALAPGLVLWLSSGPTAAGWAPTTVLLLVAALAALLGAGLAALRRPVVVPAKPERLTRAEPVNAPKDVAPPTQAAFALARTPIAVDMGRYRLLRPIGEGGMAELHLAAAAGPEGFTRHFVVKRLHPHLAHRPEIVSQFVDEARLQARLVHSNIVPVYDFGRAGDEYFIALEYVHGRDLDQLLQRHQEVTGRPLPLPVVGFVIGEVLRALAYAHSRTDRDGQPLGLVHRDISPGNVLVSFRGEVKLSDFGIAKAEQRLSHTEVGVVKGNLAFMAPEQARSGQVDQRSDLFSVGMVMLYCLTGQSLYRGEDMNPLLRAALGPQPQQLAALRDLPAEIAPVLERALAAEPAQRYQDAAEFARALDHLMTEGRAALIELIPQLFAEEMQEAF